MIDEAVRLFGKVDVLVNNAGLMDDFSPVGEFDDETFEKVMHPEPRRSRVRHAAGHQGVREGRAGE